MVVAYLARDWMALTPIANRQSPIFTRFAPFQPLPKRRESQTFSVPARVSVLNVFAHSSFCPLFPLRFSFQSAIANLQCYSPISPEIGRI
jgi:hypothetical protein